MTRDDTDSDLEGVRICIFAKPPVPGEVNTRLAPAIGAEAAARLAKAFLEDTLALVTSFGWAVPTLAVTSSVREYVGIPLDVEEWPQGEGDLGERVERILRRGLEDAPAVIALGVDSPGLPPTLLRRARRALGSSDAVIGPTADGGFYTLGLTRIVEGLLHELSWSVSTTCRDTVQRLRANDYSPLELPAWFDVNVQEDLERLAVAVQSGEVDAPHTAEVLATLGG